MTTIEFIRKDGEKTVLHVAGTDPITSAWLHAMSRELLRPTNVITLMPPCSPIPLRTESTDRPYVS